jgi:hypothetical protein
VTVTAGSLTRDVEVLQKGTELYVEVTKSSDVAPVTGSALGAVTPSSGNYESGMPLTLSAGAGTYYNFQKWQRRVAGTYQDLSWPATYEFTLTAGNNEYRAMYTRTHFNVTGTASPSAGGSISGGGWAAKGSSSALVATANARYIFSQWSDGTTSSSKTILSVTADTALTATFVPWSISFSPTSVTLGGDASSIDVTVTSNMTWYVHGYPSWVASVTKVNATTMRIMVLANASGVERSGNINISPDGDAGVNFSVTQLGPVELEVYPPSLSFDIEPYGEKEVSVSSDITWYTEVEMDD